MKLANGMGSVYKMHGKRRNPWIARKTKTWINDEATGKSKQVYITIGYYRTRQDALTALIEYNQNPYDISVNTITFSEVYEKWSDEHFKTIVPSACRTWVSAYNYCKPLYNMRMRDIRVNHLEQTIKDADVGGCTKARMKSLFNLMYRYAMKHEIVDKDYAALCDSIKKPKPQIVRVPFSDDEIQTLWDNIQFPFVDMLLIGIYSGWRPQELAILRIEDVDLEHKCFTGGLKTDAGRNRTVPIHPAIEELVIKNYNYAVQLKSPTLFNDETSQTGASLTYDKYRNRFNKVMKRFDMSHRPHDTRHTFVTKAKKAKMNDYMIKLIIGHEIDDVTEKVYTHRTIEDFREAMNEIK